MRCESVFKKILNSSNYKLLIKFFIYLLVFLIFFTLYGCYKTIYLNCKVSRVINEFNDTSYLKQITNSIVAYSPNEDPTKYLGQALELLEINLTLNLLMLYLIFIVIFVFTFKLLAEKQVNFNFILKLPFGGQALHSILNKMLSYYTTTSNIWFYFMFACLFIGIAASAFATYGCIVLLR